MNLAKKGGKVKELEWKLNKNSKIQVNHQEQNDLRNIQQFVIQEKNDKIPDEVKKVILERT